MGFAGAGKTQGAGQVLLATLLLTACAGSDGNAPPVDRVVLVGLDGLDWEVMAPLIRDGSMPHLARFIERGVSGELATLPTTVAPTYSPIIWASVATGKLPAKHGITGFGKTPDGRIEHTVPYTSNSRRARALWNILGDLGRRVAVVGWWTTWPAEQVNGIVVSDRIQYTRMNLWFGLPRHGQELPAQTHPPELFEELVDSRATRTELHQDLLSRFRPGEQRQVPEPDLHDPWYELYLAYSRDEVYRRILDRVLDREDFDFIAFYLNGTDIVSHYFWKYHFPDQWPHPIPPDELLERRSVLARYYAYADEAIAPLLDLAGERCLVIVVSDHGFATGTRSDSPHISGTHYRTAPPGVIAAAGGRIGRGTRIDGAGVLDLAPTILHALGHPVARDMDGQVIPLADAERSETEWIETYEAGSERKDHDPIASETDEAIVERLRALGYL